LQQRTGETPQGFALRAVNESVVPENAVTTITGNYLNARYGPGDEQALATLRSSIAAIP
jgi:hypothetical protein